MSRTEIDGLEVFTIDADLIEKFEALEPAAKRVIWTKEKDELLLLYWPKKNHVEVSKLLGVCPNTARARYRTLIS